MDDKNKAIVYFPNWAEDSFTQTLDKNIQVPDLPEGFNIMFAGNIGEAQDFETILSAANNTKSKNINWILIGDGRKLNWVKSQVRSYNLHNVVTLGRYPIETMPYFFNMADVMLLTLKNSLISDLTVPAKLQAYAASGKIILAAVNGETNTIIKSYNIGLACESGDINSLSENAIKLKNMSEKQRNLMEINSKKLYNTNYKKSILLNNLLNLLSLLLHNLLKTYSQNVNTNRMNLNVDFALKLSNYTSLKHF